MDNISCHKISSNAISRTHFSQDSQDSYNILAVLHHERSDSEPGTDTVGIYVESHEGKNRECFIWIRFEKNKLCEKGYLPPLLEDPLISETCALAESASHHLFPGGECFAPFQEVDCHKNIKILTTS